jgi:hypothetical protein
MFRFLGSMPIAELNDYHHWVAPLVGADGRIDIFFADLPGAVPGSGGEICERHRENVLDQSLADTFPASDAVSIAQPGGDGIFGHWAASSASWTTWEQCSQKGLTALRTNLVD